MAAIGNRLQQLQRDGSDCNCKEVTEITKRWQQSQGDGNDLKEMAAIAKRWKQSQ